MKTHNLLIPPVPEDKHWLLGNTKSLMSDILGYFENIHKEYGEIVYLKGPVPASKMYVTYNADHVKHILIDNNKNYRKGNFIKILKPLIGKGLIISEGDFWRKQRRVVQTAFYKDKINDMMSGMIICINEMVCHWENTYPDGSTIDLSSEMNKLALNIVAKSLFKTDLEKDVPIIKQNLSYVLTRLMKRFNNPVKYATWIPTTHNAKEKNSIHALSDIVYRIISDKKSGKIPKQGDILDILFDTKDADTGEVMNDEQLRDELISILLAGHETTAHGLSFLWYMLTENPQVQKKILKNVDCLTSSITLDNLGEVQYLRQVVQEILRLYPPAFMIQRQAIHDDKIGDYHVPKGMNIVLPIYIIHRMNTYWEDAEKFIPERFALSKTKAIPKFAYFPFGGGPRLCVGNQFAMTEMILSLAIISQKFYFKNESNVKINLSPEMVLKPTKNIILTLYRR